MIFWGVKVKLVVLVILFWFLLVMNELVMLVFI